MDVAILRGSSSLPGDGRDQFLRAFGGLDSSAPWKVFPLPALEAQAPLGEFREFYGLPQA